MAKMEIKGFDEYTQKLERYSANFHETAKKAVKAGASPVADAIRSGLKALPEDEFRRLKSDEKFDGIPEAQKEDLLIGLGITPVSTDREGNTNVKVGFAGYGSLKTKKYPKGVPNALIARSVESGSSVRKKTPFVRSATNKSKQKAIDAMQKEILKDIKIYAL